MLAFLPCLWAISTLVLSAAADKTILGSNSVLMSRNVKKTALLSHLQVTKRDLQLAANTANILPSQPSVTVPTITTQAEEPMVQRRSEPHARRTTSLSIRIKVYSYLSNLLAGIKIRHANIRRICAGGVNRQNAQVIGWRILAELQAILALCLACATQLKKCNGSPIPSSTPVPGGSNGGPSVGDLCQIIYQLSCEIKSCYQLVGGICALNPMVKQIIQDCLCQITESLSVCFTSAGRQVVGVIGAAVPLYGKNMGQFFNPVGFGFNLVGQVFQNKALF